ncbi:DNA topoisomerase III [gut metagenome]|uniref:DNA topoisomerase III n=1 Tax=gut metagenome TaxID=749906 RepID=J9D679_9ZZZZ
METAGKTVEDDELRDALKENGIGRPSTRAAIIETLFRRQYIRRQRKNILATSTGMELISLIKEELLKSAELTGLWEKKLRQIEHHEYSAAQFIDELKIMVSDIVRQVLSDNSNRHVTQTVSTEATKAMGKAKTEAASTGNDKPVKAKSKRRIIREGSLCPECGLGKVIKGKTAYGCSRWKEGCNWRKPFKK